MMIPSMYVVDQAIDQVNDKMKYFEGRSNQLLGDMRDAFNYLED